MPGGKWIFQHPILYFGLFFCDVVYSICFDHLLKTFVSYYLPCDSFTWWLLYINVVCVICTWPRWYVRHLFHAKPRGSFRGGLSWWHSRGLLQVRTALLCRWVNACCCIGCVCGWLFLLLLLWWLLWLKLICLMFVLQLFLLLMLLHRPAGCTVSWWTICWIVKSCVTMCQPVHSAVRYTWCFVILCNDVFCTLPAGDESI